MIQYLYMCTTHTVGKMVLYFKISDTQRMHLLYSCQVLRSEIPRSSQLYFYFCCDSCSHSMSLNKRPFLLLWMHLCRKIHSASYSPGPARLLWRGSFFYAQIDNDLVHLVFTATFIQHSGPLKSLQWGRQTVQASKRPWQRHASVIPVPAEGVRAV